MRDKKMVMDFLEKCGTNRDCPETCPYESDRGTQCMEDLMADALEVIKTQDNDLAAMQCALDKANEKLGYVNPDYFYDLELGRDQLKAWYECWRYEEMERLKPMLVRTETRRVLEDDSGDEAVYSEDVFYHCPIPNCNGILACRHKNDRIHYCPNCGQAVKWE